MSAESYLATVQRMVQWAIRDINRLIARVDMTDPDAARDALQAELPTLISVWGEAAATVAAEYFEELVDAPAVLADPVDSEAVEKMVGWAVGPLYGVKNDDGTVMPPDPAKARRNLQGASQRHIQNAGRNTIRYSSESRDGVAWARILQGETDCAFCVVLASRGAIFDSRETASFKTWPGGVRAIGESYHDHCDCQIVPIRTPDDYPEGYDPDVFYEQYMAARKVSSAKVLETKFTPGGETNILQNMRKMYGMK